MAKKRIKQEAKENVVKRGGDIFEDFGIPPSQTPSKPPIVPLGFEALDNKVFQIGGLPLKRIVEFYGPEHGGKTVSLMRGVAMVQQAIVDGNLAEYFPQDGKPTPVVWFDTENSFDFDWASANGVIVDDPSLFRYHQVTVAEEAMELITKYFKSGRCPLIVLDSIGQINVHRAIVADAFETNKTTTAKGTQGEYSQATVPGVLAKATTAFVKSITHYQNTSYTGFWYSNQLRDKIGVLHGPTEDTPGGRALKHATHQRIRVRKVEDVEESGVVVGIKVSYAFKKNKLGLSKSTDDSSHPVFYFENGIERSRIEGLFDKAVRLGVLTISGAWIKWGDKTWQGRDNFKKVLTNDLDLREDLEEAIRNFKAEPSSSDEPTALRRGRFALGVEDDEEPDYDDETEDNVSTSDNSGVSETSAD
jgi:recombination protein RecA